MIWQGSKKVLVRSYFRVSQAAGQVNVLIFLLKIKFFPCMPINFVMQGKCLFSDIARPVWFCFWWLYPKTFIDLLVSDACLWLGPPRIKLWLYLWAISLFHYSELVWLDGFYVIIQSKLFVCFNKSAAQFRLKTKLASTAVCSKAVVLLLLIHCLLLFQVFVCVFVLVLVL